MFLRRLVSAVLTAVLLSGCAVTLPKKVDYVLDDNTDPRIEQPDDKTLTQAAFDNKIDEVIVKAKKHIIPDSARSNMVARAESLMANQQEYFLKNENIPAKSAKFTGIVGTVAWVGFCLGMAASMEAHGGPYDLASPGALLIMVVGGAPLAFFDSWIVGGVGGLIFREKR